MTISLLLSDEEVNLLVSCRTHLIAHATNLILDGKQQSGIDVLEFALGLHDFAERRIADPVLIEQNGSATITDGFFR